MHKTLVAESVTIIIFIWSLSGTGCVGFFPSHAWVVGAVGFLVWVDFGVALGWAEHFFVPFAAWCYVGWDGMRMGRYVVC